MALTDEGLIDIPGMASRWVRLARGAKCHYTTAGDSGPAVVLLHGGIPGSSGTAGWRFMAPFLGANGFRVYCPDQPGYGLTEDSEHNYIYGRGGAVDFLQDFTSALCLDKFHIGGNSMGTTNSSRYIMAHPEQIISFALIAGGLGDVVPDEARVPAKALPSGERANTDAFDGTKESMTKMMEGIIYRTAAISDDLLTMRTNQANKNAEYHAVLRTYQRTPDVNQLLRISTKDRFNKLTIPGLYLHGVDDVLNPVENGYLQEDACPNIQFFYPNECGHQGQTDQPEMFNQVFLEFFRDGKVSRKTADWAGVSKRRPELTDRVSEK
jgi:2-hydroxy-6-oxonona-2,4-dienedioate hydrolase